MRASFSCLISLRLNHPPRSWKVNFVEPALARFMQAKIDSPERFEDVRFLFQNQNRVFRTGRLAQTAPANLFRSVMLIEAHQSDQHSARFKKTGDQKEQREAQDPDHPDMLMKPDRHPGRVCQNRNVTRQARAAGRMVRGRAKRKADSRLVSGRGSGLYRT